MILDIGPQIAGRAGEGGRRRPGTIVWNGPVGVFEMDAVRQGHRGARPRHCRVESVLARRRRRHVAAIHKFGIEGDIDYISTAGGAFLEFLEGKMLPAVAALEARADG